MDIKKEEFGKIHGTTVNKFTLTNDNGMSVEIIEYGARIKSLKVPDKNGILANIVKGFDTMKEYEEKGGYHGAICGRTSGRISGAKFELKGQTYQLAKNDGENNLHGGEKNFSRVVWNGEVISGSVKLNYLSKDGEEGYPGNFNISVIYTLDNTNRLTIDYQGTTDKPTIANMTNHAYFNLSGDFNQTIFDHTMQIDSDKFCDLDENAIPTGFFIELVGTASIHPFNFNKEDKLERSIDEQYPKGIDHPFLLSGDKTIKLTHPATGRTMSIITDKPAVVIYTAGNSSEEERSKSICLEVQSLPDAINQERFGDIVITPEKEYKSTSHYDFGIID